ncbi:hypothetical protein M885DRAFT_506737 [Pelagophyceae sp. CCMP2097]|nr:hypothetical protein M885DRAFT_506737 [Pelagophyceae sp. CCMP2097]
MMPGVAAAVALPLSVAVGAVVGNHYAAREEMDTGRPHKLVWLSVTAGVVSLVFFLWALANCLLFHFDLGVVSFPVALLASCYGAGLFERCVPLRTELYRLSAVVGYGLVAANYCIGITVAEALALRVYFCMGAATFLAFLCGACVIAKDGGLSTEQPVQYSRI